MEMQFGHEKKVIFFYRISICCISLRYSDEIRMAMSYADKRGEPQFTFESKFNINMHIYVITFN